MAYEIELKVSLEDKDFVLETLTKRGCNWEKSKKQYDKIYYKKDYTDLLVRLNEEQAKIQKCKVVFCFSNSKNLKILKKY